MINTKPTWFRHQTQPNPPDLRWPKSSGSSSDLQVLPSSRSRLPPEKKKKLPEDFSQFAPRCLLVKRSPPLSMNEALLSLVATIYIYIPNSTGLPPPTLTTSGCKDEEDDRHSTFKHMFLLGKGRMYLLSLPIWTFGIHGKESDLPSWPNHVWCRLVLRIPSTSFPHAVRRLLNLPQLGETRYYGAHLGQDHRSQASSGGFGWHGGSMKSWRSTFWPSLFGKNQTRHFNTINIYIPINIYIIYIELHLSHACSQSFRSLSSASMSFFTWSITWHDTSQSNSNRKPENKPFIAPPSLPLLITEFHRFHYWLNRLDGPSTLACLMKLFLEQQNCSIGAKPNPTLNPPLTPSPKFQREQWLSFQGEVSELCLWSEVWEGCIFSGPLLLCWPKRTAGAKFGARRLRS